VDALGGLYDPNASDPYAISPRVRAAVKDSGLTALQLTVGDVGNGPDRFRLAVEGIARARGMIRANPDLLRHVLNASDLAAAKSENRLGLVLGFQDTTPLEGDPARVGVFAELGMRVIQLTYNKRNLAGDGALEAADAGLSDMGREIIAEIERNRLLLDLSHGGRRTIAEALGAATRPPTISHTGCRAVTDYPRNVDDAALRATAEKGGVVGIYFMPFLRTSGQATREDLIRHLEHAVKVAGEDHVGIGTDGGLAGVVIDDAARRRQREFVERRQALGIAAPGEAADVFNIVTEYNHPGRYLQLAEDLTARGWPASRVDKLLGANFARLYRDVWG